MEAIMALRDLISWGRDQPSVPSQRREEVSPFLTLHREMNRLFDDVFNSFGNSPSLLGGLPAWPSVEVVQSDKDIRISAELPGLDEKDVEGRWCIIPIKSEGYQWLSQNACSVNP